MKRQMIRQIMLFLTTLLTLNLINCEDINNLNRNSTCRILNIVVNSQFDSITRETHKSDCNCTNDIEIALKAINKTTINPTCSDSFQDLIRSFFETNNTNDIKTILIGNSSKIQQYSSLATTTPKNINKKPEQADVTMTIKENGPNPRSRVNVKRPILNYLRDQEIDSMDLMNIYKRGFLKLYNDNFNGLAINESDVSSLQQMFKMYNRLTRLELMTEDDKIKALHYIKNIIELILDERTIMDLIEEGDNNRAKRSLRFGFKSNSLQYTLMTEDKLSLGTFMHDKLMRGVPKDHFINWEIILKESPKCETISQKTKNIIDSEKYRIYIGIEIAMNGQICLVAKVCEIGYVYSKDGCIESEQVGLVESNIISFSISDHITEINNFKLDSSLSMDLSNICSIGEYKIRNCQSGNKMTQEITLLNVNKQWTILSPDSYHIVTTPDFMNPDSYLCNINPSSMDCQRGDEIYLKYSSQERMCTCEFKKEATEVAIKYHQILIPVNIMATISVQIVYPSKQYKQAKSNRCESCEFECLNGRVKYNLNLDTDFIRVCRYKLCDSIALDHDIKIGSFSLQKLKYTEGSLAITLYHSDLGTYSKAEVLCMISDSCSLITCNVCKERLLNYHCQNVISGIIWIVIILTVICSLSVVIKVFTFTTYIVKAFNWVVSSTYRLILKIFRLCSQMRDNNTQTTPRNTDVLYTAIKMESGATSEESTPRRKFVRPIIGPLSPITVIMSFLIIFLLDSCLSCSTFSHINLESYDCQMMGGLSKCDINKLIEANIAPIGQDLCINVLGNTGSIVKIIKVKTKDISLKCNKKHLYYTNDGRMSLAKLYHCDGAANCTSSNCQNVKPQDNIKEIPQHRFNRLGETGCRLVNGFWGNGCFLATSACMFYRVTMEPTNIGYSVFTCDSWSWMVDIEIEEDLNHSFKKTEYSITPVLPTSTNIGDITLTSISTPPSNIYNHCFIKYGDENDSNRQMAVCECNRARQLIAGTIGEVQCPSIKAARDLSNNCVMSKSIYDIGTSGNDIILRSQVTNVTAIFNSNTLPIDKGTYRIDYDETLPTIRLTKNSMFSLIINFHSYSVEIVSSKIKCTTSFKNMTGCYNCEAGSRVCFDISANSYPAVVKIECESNIMFAFNIERSGTHCQIMDFSRPEINIKCKAVCSGNEEAINIYGHLSYMDTIVKPITNSTIISVKEVTSAWSDLFNIFSLTSIKAWMYLLFAITMSIVIIYILMTMVLVVKKNVLRSGKQLV